MPFMHCVNIEVYTVQAEAVPSSWMHQWQDEDTHAALLCVEQRRPGNNALVNNMQPDNSPNQHTQHSTLLYYVILS